MDHELLRGPQRPAWVDAYAQAMLEVAPDDVPRDWMWTRSAVILAELTAANGRGPACARWYDALAPYRARTAVAGGAVLFLGAVAHYLGLLAAALDRPEEARAHFERALAVHERLGAGAWAARSRRELAGDRRPDGGAAGGEVFRRDGTLWTLTYAGRTVRMRDAKGLHDLATLLAAPGRPVAAAELAAAAGLGGRVRRLGDQSERARKTVTARIRDVIDRVERLHPALGAHLRASVTTGTYCSYSPPAPTAWEL